MLNKLTMKQMSHEMRTPTGISLTYILTVASLKNSQGIIGMVELLADDPTLSSEQREYVESVQLSKALLTIVNDILDFSKIESGCLGIEEVPFNVSSTVGELGKLLSMFANQKGLKFAYENRLDENLEVLGDPGRIEYGHDRATRKGCRATSHTRNACPNVPYIRRSNAVQQLPTPSTLQSTQFSPIPTQNRPPTISQDASLVLTQPNTQCGGIAQMSSNLGYYQGQNRAPELNQDAYVPATQYGPPPSTQPHVYGWSGPLFR